MVLAEDLRQAVLRAAMQGKLTNHLNTDSSVDDLLMNIRNEKKNMIANHIVGKEKPYSTQTKFDEQPYDIPENWRYERFGTIMVNRDAERIPLSAASRAGKEKKYDYYGASGVIDKTDSFLFDKELLLIGEDGANLLSRSTPIAFIASGKYWVNNHAHVLDVCCGLNLKYICYYINSIDLSIYVTGTAQPKMNQSNMNAIWVPLPPIEEQQRIVDKINEIMPKIDEYEKIEKELEILKKEFPTDMKDALLQAAMQGKLTEQLESDSSVDELLEIIKKEKEELIAQKKIKKEKLLPDIEEEEIPFDIPENWRWVRLGNTGTLTRGNGIKRDEVTETGFPCVRYGELYTTYKIKFDTAVSHTSKELFDKSQKIDKNDILMALTGENNFDIALALAYVGSETVAMGGDLTRWSNHHMNPLYLVYAMNSSYAIHKKSEMAKGDIIVHISSDKLATILLPIPPLEEQNRIVERLDALLPLCEDLKEK